MRSGYFVKIVGFIPTNPKDLADHASVLGAIDSAKSVVDHEGPPSGRVKNAEGEVIALVPSADAMFSRMEVETFDVRPVTRRDVDHVAAFTNERSDSK